jgi:uncharacterized protein (DUF362 family)
MRAGDVILVKCAATDGWGTAPYGPAETFPESRNAQPGDNRLYGAVRQLLAGMRLDEERFGEESWNPLRALVGPGGKIVVKPNLVRHRHGGGGPLNCVVTDPRLIRAILDYAVAAVEPGGTIFIADSPLQSCDFKALTAALGLEAVMEAAERGRVEIRLLDYRREEVRKDAAGLIVHRRPLSGDPDGYTAIDLAEASELQALTSRDERFRVTQYDREITARHHRDGNHEFLIPRSLLAADLVISLPKIKTHRKAGMTGALKNLVGINGSKAWLPHHRSGAVSEGGDEYLRPSARKRWMSRIWERMDRSRSPRLRRGLRGIETLIRRSGTIVAFPDPYFEGSWWGNRTMPAMVCDLNRIFLYAGSDGRLGDRPVRRVLVLADAVIAGEGEGPLEPTPHELGVLLGGVNPVAVDWAAATLMGLEPRRIPTLTLPLCTSSRPLAPFRPEEIAVLEAGGAPGEWHRRSLPELAAAVARPSVPASGWQGHIEAPPAAGRRTA